MLIDQRNRLRGHVRHPRRNGLSTTIMDKRDLGHRVDVTGRPTGCRQEAQRRYRVGSFYRQAGLNVESSLGKSTTVSYRKDSVGERSHSHNQFLCLPYGLNTPHRFREQARPKWIPRLTSKENVSSQVELHPNSPDCRDQEFSLIARRSSQFSWLDHLPTSDPHNPPSGAALFLFQLDRLR